MIYRCANGHFVISSGHVWLPGSFDSERAARYGFRFSDSEIKRLERKKRPGTITFNDLRDLRARRVGGNPAL